jgi:hypothetical protein
MHGAAIGEEEHCERRQDADGARPSQGSQRAVAQGEGAESSTCTLTEVDCGGVQREGDVPGAGRELDDAVLLEQVQRETRAPHNASTARVPGTASADPENKASTEMPSRARANMIRMTVISLA